MSAPDHWQSLKPETRMEMEKHARQLVRGSIIEDAAARFMAMCMAEAIGESKRRADLSPDAPKVKALVWVELARGLFGATTPFGCYHVWEGHYQAPCDKMGQPALDPRSEAQADYEARILAALAKPQKRIADNGSASS